MTLMDCTFAVGQIPFPLGVLGARRPANGQCRELELSHNAASFCFLSLQFAVAFLSDKRSLCPLLIIYVVFCCLICLCFGFLKQILFESSSLARSLDGTHKEVPRPCGLLHRTIGKHCGFNFTPSSVFWVTRTYGGCGNCALHLLGTGRSHQISGCFPLC